MNELVTDLKSLELETLKNLKNSKASNTLRAYHSDFRDFFSDREDSAVSSDSELGPKVFLSISNVPNGEALSCSNRLD